MAAPVRKSIDVIDSRLRYENRSGQVSVQIWGPQLVWKWRRIEYLSKRRPRDIHACFYPSDHADFVFLAQEVDAWFAKQDGKAPVNRRRGKITPRENVPSFLYFSGKIATVSVDLKKPTRTGEEAEISYYRFVRDFSEAGKWQRCHTFRENDHVHLLRAALTVQKAIV